MTSDDTLKPPVVHRPSANAVWKHDHRWGSGFGDSTSLVVSRTDGGILRAGYGDNSLEIRAVLVPIFAAMVAAAADWTDQDKEARPEDADEMACAWSDYRSDYGVHASDITAAHKAFAAGWKAAREGDQSGAIR